MKTFRDFIGEKKQIKFTKIKNKKFRKALEDFYKKNKSLLTKKQIDWLLSLRDEDIDILPSQNGEELWIRDPQYLFTDDYERGDDSTVYIWNLTYKKTFWYYG